MKKFFSFLILLLILPLINVNGLNCYNTTKENPLELKGDNAIFNFTCAEVEGDSLVFKYNNQDYSKYFKVTINDDKTANIDIDNTLSFESNIEIGLIIIEDGKEQKTLYVKNTAYVEPTTTTTTTNPNEITYTVTLDQNDGSEKTTKTCTVKKEGEICNVTLPKLEKDKFTGWGTAPSCKDGKIGSTKVVKNITYYACYENNEETNNNENTDLYLKSLDIVNASNDEKIDFGIFSIKKREYEFKVLNEVENIKLNTTAPDNIKVTITGNENLIVGENEITIELKDDNNNISQYKLKVTRLNEGETINNTHYLKSLVIGGYPIDFNKETLIYNLTIPNDINKLVINYESEKDTDKIEILGNEDLENGSIIRIKVIGEDNNETEYTINIIKENNSNNWLLIAIALIFILIIILIILIFIKRKNNKKKKNNIKSDTIKQETIETL